MYSCFVLDTHARCAPYRDLKMREERKSMNIVCSQCTQSVLVLHNPESMPAKLIDKVRAAFLFCLRFLQTRLRSTSAVSFALASMIHFLGICIKSSADVQERIYYCSFSGCKIIESCHIVFYANLRFLPLN